MECVCIEKCYLKHETEVAAIYEVGDTRDFRKCPPHFRTALEYAKELDFDSVEESALRVTEFNLKDLRDFIKDKYKVNVGNMGKEKMVSKLMDLRYREIL